VRRYFGRKLVIYLLTFWVAATIDWLIPRFMPGDPIQSLLSRTQVAPEAVADLIAYYKALFGLDQSIPQQYLNSGSPSRTATSGAASTSPAGRSPT
jgi:peptide/nickel transport system permease protein